MKKRFFLKRFYTYFLNMLVPTIIISFLLFNIVVGNTEASLKEDSENSLKVAHNNLDLIINNAFYQHNLMTTNPSFVLSLRKLLNQDEIDYNDLGFLKTLKTTMKSIVESHEYVDSIYLYLDGAGKFLSSSTGVEPIDSYYDSSWYDTISSFKQDSRDLDYWVENRMVDKTSSSPEKRYITLYRRMAYIDGIIVINIDISKFNLMLDTIFSDPDTCVFLYNSNNDILAYNKAAERKSDAFRRELTYKISEKNILGKWVMIGGEKNQINNIEYSDYGLNFVTAVSKKALWKALSPVVGLLVAVFIGNCLVVFIIAYIVTKRNFDHISYIIKTFEKAEMGILPKEMEISKEKDEYDLIMNNIIRMFINATYLNNQLEQKQYKTKIAEMTALQSQINPHFLFNTLQTLSFEILKQTDEDNLNLNHIIQGLSDLLKYALMPSMEKVPLQQEITYLKKYIEIQKYRFTDNLIVYYQIDDDILDYPVIRLILQPIIENSILHGIRYKKDKGYIKIKIFHIHDILSFHVIDNGIGMEQDKIKELYQQLNEENSIGRGIGIANVNQRLLLNYGESYGIHIRSKKGLGTSVTFKIPYQLGINENKDE
jgi:Putative regulator of cell autolysis